MMMVLLVTDAVEVWVMPLLRKTIPFIGILDDI